MIFLVRLMFYTTCIVTTRSVFLFFSVFRCRCHLNCHILFRAQRRSPPHFESNNMFFPFCYRKNSLHHRPTLQDIWFRHAPQLAVANLNVCARREHQRKPYIRRFLQTLCWQPCWQMGCQIGNLPANMSVQRALHVRTLVARHLRHFCCLPEPF